MEALEKFRATLLQGLDFQCDALSSGIQTLEKNNTFLREQAAKVEQLEKENADLRAKLKRAATRGHGKGLPAASPNYGSAAMNGDILKQSKESNRARDEGISDSLERLINENPELESFLQEKADDYTKLREAHVKVLALLRKFQNGVQKKTLSKHNAPQGSRQVQSTNGNLSSDPPSLRNEEHHVSLPPMKHLEPKFGSSASLTGSARISQLSSNEVRGGPFNTPANEPKGHLEAQERQAEPPSIEYYRPEPLSTASTHSPRPKNAPTTHPEPDSEEVEFLEERPAKRRKCKNALLSRGQTLPPDPKNSKPVRVKVEEAIHDSIQALRAPPPETIHDSLDLDNVGVPLLSNMTTQVMVSHPLLRQSGTSSKGSKTTWQDDNTVDRDGQYGDPGDMSHQRSEDYLKRVPDRARDTRGYEPVGIMKTRTGIEQSLESSVAQVSYCQVSPRQARRLVHNQKEQARRHLHKDNLEGRVTDPSYKQQAGLAVNSPASRPMAADVAITQHANHGSQNGDLKDRPHSESFELRTDMILTASNTFGAQLNRGRGSGTELLKRTSQSELNRMPTRPFEGGSPHLRNATVGTGHQTSNFPRPLGSSNMEMSLPGVPSDPSNVRTISGVAHERGKVSQEWQPLESSSPGAQSMSSTSHSPRFARRRQLLPPAVDDIPKMTEVKRPEPTVPRGYTTLSHLRPEDFEINPTSNAGLDFAYQEVVRGKAKQRCLPNCTKKDCCGDMFLKAVRIAGVHNLSMDLPHGSLDDSRTKENEILQEYLGYDVQRLAGLSADERTELINLALTRKFAEQHGKHRYVHERAASPPGFWTTDMPSTQELKADRNMAEQLNRQKVEERYREAMRPGGRWKLKQH